MNNYLWLYWCPGLTCERWQDECLLVGERSSLFRPFAESPFFGFRGIVARSGTEYHVTVAAETDMYPKYEPWVYVEPGIAGANADGRLHIDVGWNRGSSTFADLIVGVIAHVGGVTADVLK